MGSIAVQFAKQLGARVVAGASTKAKRERAAKLGADHVVDYTAADWPEQLRTQVPEGVDVALEMRGGASVAQTLGCLAPFGRLLVYGMASGDAHRLGQPDIDRWLATPALNQSVSAFNVGLYFGLRPELARAAVGTLIELVASGKVDVHVPHKLPLADAAKAHDLLEGRASSGKIVLHPWH